MLLFVLALGCYLACAQPLAAAELSHSCCDPKSKAASDNNDSCERPDALVQHIVDLARPVPAFTLLPFISGNELVIATATAASVTDTSPPTPLRI